MRGQVVGHTNAGPPSKERTHSLSLSLPPLVAQKYLGGLESSNYKQKFRKLDTTFPTRYSIDVCLHL